MPITTWKTINPYNQTESIGFTNILTPLHALCLSNTNTKVTQLFSLLDHKNRCDDLKMVQ